MRVTAGGKTCIALGAANASFLANRETHMQPKAPTSAHKNMGAADPVRASYRGVRCVSSRLVAKRALLSLLQCKLPRQP